MKEISVFFFMTTKPYIRALRYYWCNNLTYIRCPQKHFKPRLIHEELNIGTVLTYGCKTRPLSHIDMSYQYVYIFRSDGILVSIFTLFIFSSFNSDSCLVFLAALFVFYLIIAYLDMIFCLMYCLLKYVGNRFVWLLPVFIYSAQLELK